MGVQSQHVLFRRMLQSLLKPNVGLQRWYLHDVDRRGTLGSATLQLVERELSSVAVVQDSPHLAWQRIFGLRIDPDEQWCV